MPKILLAVAALALTVAAARADLPPLIPRTVLFGNPEKTGPQIAPDGKHLAWIAPDQKDVLQVWIRAIDEKEGKAVTADKKRGVRQYFWTYRPDELMYLQDRDGDENFHLFQVNVRTGLVRDLTPFEGARAQVVDVDPKVPNEALVGLNLKSKAKFDVYRINLENGAADFDTDNPGNIVGWTADPDFQIRAAMAANPAGGNDLLYRATTKDKWKTLHSWGFEEQGSLVGFAADGKTLYLQANHDANTMRLLALDTETGKEKMLAQDEEFDLGGVMFHPTRRTVQAVAFLRDKLYWNGLGPDVKDDLDFLAKAHPGQFSVSSRDQADQTWIVSYTRDDAPTTFVLYRRGDKADKKTEVLFTTQPELEKYKLAAMQPVSFKARDGLTVHGYLTLPVGVAHKDLPTALLVHGGPWARDVWGYHPQAQWLANRGYAVMQVNFRGSTGYGKKFLNAGNREWGAKMHDDLLDAVNWLVKQGTTDVKRVGIMGGSYGGYATLAGLAFTPDVFACGVDIVGPSNIVSLLKTIPPYWAPAKMMFSKRVGDLEKEEEFLKSRSPLFFVDKIKSPLLIAQGANDPRVKQAESDQIVEGLRKAGKTVEYLLYTDEGHGFVRPENRLHFYAHAEQFLAKHLGGRAEPLTEVKGHSGVVK